MHQLKAQGLISNLGMIFSRHFKLMFGGRHPDGWMDSINFALSLEDKKLVIRDHTHLNFTSRSSNDYELQTFKSLNCFDVLVVSLTRHPVDQFLSCMSRDGLKKYLTTEHFVNGYVEYHKAIKGIPLIRYEDLVNDPYLATKKACDILDLVYQDNMVESFSNSHSVSGDRDQNSRAYKAEKVTSLSRREGWNDVAAEFRKSPDLLRLMVDLGYEI